MSGVGRKSIIGKVQSSTTNIQKLFLKTKAMTRWIHEYYTADAGSDRCRSQQALRASISAPCHFTTNKTRSDDVRHMTRIRILRRMRFRCERLWLIQRLSIEIQSLSSVRNRWDDRILNIERKSVSDHISRNFDKNHCHFTFLWILPLFHEMN
jgi:hypothetical protein